MKGMRQSTVRAKTKDKAGTMPMAIYRAIEREKHGATTQAMDETQKLVLPQVIVMFPSVHLQNAALIARSGKCCLGRVQLEENAERLPVQVFQGHEQKFEATCTWISVPVDAIRVLPANQCTRDDETYCITEDVQQLLERGEPDNGERIAEASCDSGDDPDDDSNDEQSDPQAATQYETVAVTIRTLNTTRPRRRKVKSTSTKEKQTTQHDNPRKKKATSDSQKTQSKKRSATGSWKTQNQKQSVSSQKKQNKKETKREQQSKEAASASASIFALNHANRGNEDIEKKKNTKSAFRSAAFKLNFFLINCSTPKDICPPPPKKTKKLFFLQTYSKLFYPP